MGSGKPDESSDNNNSGDSSNSCRYYYGTAAAYHNKCKLEFSPLGNVIDFKEAQSLNDPIFYSNCDCKTALKEGLYMSSSESPVAHVTSSHYGQFNYLTCDFTKLKESISINRFSFKVSTFKSKTSSEVEEESYFSFDHSDCSF